MMMMLVVVGEWRLQKINKKYINKQDLSTMAFLPFHTEVDLWGWERDSWWADGEGDSENTNKNTLTHTWHSSHLTCIPHLKFTPSATLRSFNISTVTDVTVIWNSQCSWQYAHLKSTLLTPHYLAWHLQYIQQKKSLSSFCSLRNKYKWQLALSPTHRTYFMTALNTDNQINFQFK